MNDVKNEISDMLKALDEPSVSEPISEPEPEPTPTPEPEPIKEEPKVEEPVPEAKEEPEPASTPEPVKEPVLDEKDKTITELRGKIAELESKKSEPPKESQKEPPKEEPLTLETQDFTKDLDLDEITRDPAEFNKALNLIYQKAVSDAHRLSNERFSKNLPDVIRQNMELIDNMKTLRETFYKENEDLRPFQKVVATVFEELAGKSSDKTYVDLMKEVAPEVRRRLELPTKSVIKDSSSNKSEPPKLPQKGGNVGRSTTKPTKDPLQDELEEMNKILGR